MSKSAKSGTGKASDRVHVTLEFSDNHLASLLFGQFDQHLALIEKQLGIEVATRGNEVNLIGEETATTQAQQALDNLYTRLQAGETIEVGDVKGALKIAAASNRV